MIIGVTHGIQKLWLKPMLAEEMQLNPSENAALFDWRAHLKVMLSQQP